MSLLVNCRFRSKCVSLAPSEASRLIPGTFDIELDRSEEWEWPIQHVDISKHEQKYNNVGVALSIVRK